MPERISVLNRIQRIGIKNIVPIAVLFTVIIGLTQYRADSEPVKVSLLINEVMASNRSTLCDEDGDYSDWIEIYNDGDQSINLAGFGLSDKEDEPYLWTFPDIALEKDSYLLVWASGKDRAVSGEELHTNFKISKEGETLYLTHADGTVLDRMTSVSLSDDISIGRDSQESNEWFVYQDTTPGAPNSTEPQERLAAPPAFSLEGGFYTEPFSLEITTEDQDVKVYYTLDGSEPTPESLLYTDPIEIKDQSFKPNVLSAIISISTEWKAPSGPVYKGTVVRARIFKEGTALSDIVTHTYFIDPEGRSRYTLPVISLVTEKDNLFDYDEGIYVLGKAFQDWRAGHPNAKPDGGTPANYNQRGMEWEKPVSVEFFETDGSLAFAQDGGLRISGGWSRANRQKSLRLYARKEYDDQNSFDYQVFPGLAKSPYNTEPMDKFKRILLRNGGNDNNDWNATLLRDSIAQSLLENTSLDTQASRPCIVFINGEYWGIYNIRERYDEFYLETHYGVNPDQAVILDGDGWLNVGEPGDEQHYKDMIQYLKDNDIQEQKHYEYIKTQMDVDNFMDYIIGEVYFDNTDWPGNNIKFWRAKTESYQPQAPYGLDGRWRWMVYDTEFGFSIYDGDQGYKDNTLEFAAKAGGREWPNPDWSTFLFRTLLKNQEFKTAFINKFADHLNSTFEPERVLQRIDEMRSLLEPEISEHVKRWGSLGGSLKAWKDSFDILELFAENRPRYVREHITKFFGLSGEVKVTLNVNNVAYGRVQINSLGIEEQDYPWEGIYFKGVPVEIMAFPNPGYRFAGWIGAPNTGSPVLSWELNQDLSLTAVFEKE